MEKPDNELRRIIRFYKNKPNVTVSTGHTREEAIAIIEEDQANNPDTSESFLGFDYE